MTDDARIAAIAKTIIMQGELGQGAYEHYDIDRIASLAAAITSAEFVAKHLPRAPRFPSPDSFLDAMIAQAPTDGLILEFGVFSGHSITRLANARPGRAIHGFDSFTGLPEFWRPGFDAGTFALEALPRVPDNVSLHPGWFDRTLPGFLDAHPGPVAFVHVDCDLYSSTQTILAQLNARLRPGTIIAFDEYLNYPSWQMHEHKAFVEFIASTNRAYEWIGLVPSYEQAAVRLLS
ncbi:class I SAM-dependent methyltransferase [Plastoroseomonas arctica]|uniref:Class I SAM-dependent methyltransferase n=1 Tax=Plastoroseomonas arctica TaxID=1509237 RepID=A0AAF1JVR7_9PROT|nr:class I SAM-dependent methyltransferase [Plastoroseomonas arctica]MBR0653918.1 class I SAM-dependent methyltransferase [Plastoroseomonas arctica]